MLTSGTPLLHGSAAAAGDVLPLCQSYMRHGNFTVSLYGGFTSELLAEYFVPPDEVMVQVQLCFRRSRSPYEPLPPWLDEHTRNFEFPLNERLELHTTIRQAVERDGRPILGDDHGHDDLPVFLAERVTSVVDLCMQRTPFARDRSAPHGTFVVNAVIRLMSEQPPASRAYVRDATAAPVSTTSSSLSPGVCGLLMKVAYRNKTKEDDDEAPVSETTCPICLSDFEDGEEVHLTPCRHSFCLPCLKRWLYLNAACPLCRSIIGLNGLIP